MPKRDFILNADELAVGNAILMQYKAEEINHAGIYLGDGKMLHHMYGKLSEAVPTVVACARRTTSTLRYQNGDEHS
ncbi:NlpC/P60 family protein [Enterobacter cloacae complex sp. 379K3]|uniref:NlpC/P60 family protein n=1 Tax=Enterobacter cloacae complex sp. 379K3 TaxID=3395865 RepID=UPI003CEEAFBA